VAELLKVEALTATAAARFPEKRGGGLVLEGDVGELAVKLVAILKEKTAVLK
jgi:electron transfer flavoprotein beta subunit